MYIDAEKVKQKLKNKLKTRFKKCISKNNLNTGSFVSSTCKTWIFSKNKIEKISFVKSVSKL